MVERTEAKQVSRTAPSVPFPDLELGGADALLDHPARSPVLPDRGLVCESRPHYCT